MRWVGLGLLAFHIRLFCVPGIRRNFCPPCTYPAVVLYIPLLSFSSWGGKEGASSWKTRDGRADGMLRTSSQKTTTRTTRKMQAETENTGRENPSRGRNGKLGLRLVMRRMMRMMMTRRMVERRRRGQRWRRASGLIRINHRSAENDVAGTVDDGPSTLGEVFSLVRRGKAHGFRLEVPGLGFDLINS